MIITGNDGKPTIGATQKVVVNNQQVETAVEAVAQTVPQSVVGVQSVVIEQTPFGQSEGISTGSGFIVTSDGYIVTNHHVVSDDPKEIVISLDDGTTHQGEVVWADSSFDLAVVKIDVQNLPVVTLGDSEALNVGETVVAIGNPMGLQYERSVTAGIVSALNRSLLVDNSLIAEDLIQTDATINEGNSGGPLCNAQGEVIGINTYKNYEAEGMGFSVPINIAKPIIDKIITTGEFNPMVIGITGYDSQQAAYYEDSEVFEHGIYVLEVEAGSGAEKAGIQEGDIITQLNGKEVNSMLGMKSILYYLNDKDVVEISVLRGEENKVLQVEVSEIKQ